MKRTLFLLALLSSLMFQFCSPSKKIVDAEQKANPIVATVSFQTDVMPIMINKCTPCHFPETGKKKLLDTYDAVKHNINDIVTRVSLSEGDSAFMPFKSKKAPLTPVEIQILKTWRSEGFPK